MKQQHRQARMARDLDTLDTIGGRLLFRFIGGMLIMVVVVLGFSGLGVLFAGPTFESRLSAVAILILAYLIGRLTIWCFGPDRRLSLADPI